MIGKLRGAGLTPKDWTSNQLFSEQNQIMQKLVGIMLDTYEIKNSMKDLSGEDGGLTNNSIALLITDCVNGH